MNRINTSPLHFYCNVIEDRLVVISGLYCELSKLSELLKKVYLSGLHLLHYSQMSLVIGLLACLVTSVFFGSMFVALKRFKAGDGIYSQWIMSLAILCVGFINFWYQSFPGFYPFAMLGGFIWTLGNTTAIPLINRIGLSTGVLIWNSVKCITGWVTGRFGLLGMKANQPASDILNYSGLAFVIAGGIMFSLIKANRVGDDISRLTGGEEEVIEDTDSEDDSESKSLISKSSSSSKKSTKSTIVALLLKYERPICLIMCVFAGICYGINFVPVIYMIDNPDLYPNHPRDDVAYVFSHYFGIFITATLIFIVYTLGRSNQPYAPSDLALPAFVSGSMWAIAQWAFFVANQHLSQAISFPITSGPISHFSRLSSEN
ncbi:hypothetical protein Y032_0363g3519, partial [Ancylostoma ceylanicum]